MCGIVGAVCQRNVYKILIEGLSRLEYCRAVYSRWRSSITNTENLWQGSGSKGIV